MTSFALTLIRRMMHDWSRALESRDVDGLVRDYASDALVYDAIPPHMTVGVDALRRIPD